jgi:hypothetical protein
LTLRALILGLTLATLEAPGLAEGFPEVTDVERALTAVAGHPGAPAVVLAKRAELRFRDPSTGAPTTLDVEVRTKILSESGKSFGRVALGYGAGIRLERFAGRTVTPDGRAVPLPEDAVFHEERSQVRRRFAAKAAFPAVEVGAILDYRYTLRFDSLFLEPWTFDDRVPVLHSEIVYHAPHGTTAAHHLRGGPSFHTRRDETSRGTVVRIWAEDLPPVREEPYGFPWADLTRQVTIVPAAERRPDGSRVSLLDSWSTVCRTYLERVYAPLGAKTRETRRTASRLAAAAGPDPEARIAALHAFVRDGIRTSERGLGTSAASLDEVLAAGRGTYAEKALLLQGLLEAAGVPSKLVWAVDWRDGFADLGVVNPGWFEKVLVLAEPDGGRLFLDPGEHLAAGRLAPTNEGTDALLVDADEPRILRLPVSAAGASVRTARLELAVDRGGGVAGRGRLTLTGHHAWYYLGRVESAEARDAGWRRWLAAELEDFEIGGVASTAAAGEQRIEVEWTMELAGEHLLGDEVSLRPSRPFGPLRQRYTIPPENRRTAVQVSFADRDEVELTLAWPEGWAVDLLPGAVDHRSEAGAAHAGVEVDEDGRVLVYRRSLEIARTRYDPGEPYARLRELYAVLERHDAESMVLYRSE